MIPVEFQIVRQNHRRGTWVEAFPLTLASGTTILDGLNRIKWELDGSLAFRKNCRNTICGSCAMVINGRPTLACKENIGGEIARQQRILAQTRPEASALPKVNNLSLVPVMRIAPLGNLPVIKDLVVEMGCFWDKLAAVEPYVSTAARKIPEREFLQSPEERSQLDQMGNCIMCGACYAACNAVEVNPDFVGPHALAKAQRTLVDSRDDATEARLERYHQGTEGVWGCTRCYQCNAVCPMDVAPLDQIGQIKQQLLQRKDAQSSRSIRHRKVLVELVKQGGWIDERKFGVMVVGNYFRDLRGLISLGPLGLRMLNKGKFPTRFEASTGAEQVRSLIESVQTVTAQQTSPPA